jgi:phosphatidylinositol alpha-mannosyltransferase
VRIGIISPYSLTLPGGVQGQALGLARVLRGLGHPTQVLGPCDGPPPDSGVTPLGNSLPMSANGSVAPIAPDASAALRTIRALRDEDFDVLHLHEPMVPGPTMTAIVLQPCPIVGTFHAAGGSLAYDMLKPLCRMLGRRIDRSFAVSDDAVEMALDVLPSPPLVTFNGVEVERFAAAKPWAKTHPTIFFLGRHEPRKGLAVLLQAMTEINSDVRLWVAGDGPETEALRAQSAGDHRIEWLGRIREEEKLERLRAADVFCAPSLRGESFGIVLLEAMASSTPVVASNIAGYSRVARNGLDALLVDPADAGALAKALTGVLNSASVATDLVESGLERASNFSMERLANVYLEHFDDLVR